MQLLSRRNLLQFAALGAAAVALPGCAQTASSPSNTGSAGGGAVLIGTTDKVTALDPAGEYDNGSFALISNCFPFLLNTKPGSTDATPVPDIAESASFTSDKEYTVKLKSGLKFANGHDLTSEDVKYSFDRMIKINDPNGPSSLLANLDSVSTSDDLTVVFTLKVANDQTFPQVLTSPAGPIVDKDSFPADKLLDDDAIVKANAFAGPLRITDYTKNQLVSFARWDGYQGVLGAAKASTVTMKYYAQDENLKLGVQQGEVDVASRSLSATDIDSLRSDSKLKVYEGTGGEMRMLVFNFDTMPFGAKTSEPSAAKSLAVRQAIASLLDRSAVSTNVYKGTYNPLFAYVPDGFLGASPTLKSAYGDGNGGPSKDKATKFLADAGVTTPVALNIQYNPDHYGQSSSDEYTAMKSQLESSGLFTVDLKSTEWVQYNKDRVADVYPIYQLGWFPDFPDPDNYLTPFFTEGNFIHQHYSNEAVAQAITAQATEPDKTKRQALLKEIQDKLTADLPTIPLLQGKQVLIASTAVKGAENAIDISFKLRMNVLSK
ncbi:peptide/nickel transport system substrate-binding protein [Propionibacterium cyclohexanicum]|uniref:Peptide/nickel transport system substrate-binding protein n=1 Tax=Propionibacterium cyclohexanicum TaxID=64702 RepID=A0A1H9T0N2_9ACTN|nr:ABC transporter substrate-binding protein [Propionibacterium cyclohexanicum]SER90627.1 peptide/nickel transport system substrate-binding protein [Propionibacterium cyclohexanicum]